MSDTMKAALDAALRFHGWDKEAPLGAVIATAKDFYRELAVAAPSGIDAYDEAWHDQVYTWLRVLNGDQRGCVQDAVNRIDAERNPPQMPVPLVQPSPRYAPVPPPPGAPVPEAWALLDKLNGPQPYPGTAAPIGPLVTRDELERELAKLGGDPRSLNDVQQAAEAPIPPPVLAAGDCIRIRPEGADPFTSPTYSAIIQHGTEGFYALVPPGTFAEARTDEIEPASMERLLKALAPAGRRGTVVQQVKELVGTVEHQGTRIKELETKAKADEEQLRGILGALPGYENHDTGSFAAEETSIDAAQRVMHELGQARARLRDLES